MSNSVPMDFERPSDPNPPDGKQPDCDSLLQRTVKRELIAEVRDSWLPCDPVSPSELLQRCSSLPPADQHVAGLHAEDQLNRTRAVEIAPFVAAEALSQPQQLEDPLHRTRAVNTTPFVAAAEPTPPRDSPAKVLHTHEHLHSMGISLSGDTILRMPEIGEHLFGFDLIRELGRGAFARVFLANQRELAGRPVVLKVSQIEGTEPQTLAQLQHTHIVPIYSVHENRARAGLRALCMPYFGGASLSEVLKKVWRETTSPRKGEELMRGLDELMTGSRNVQSEPAAANLVSETIIEQTPRARYAQLSYVHTAASVVAALADGLAHAHQRGILHRDIKPSNILLADDGQPMLLDFNLAQDASLAGTHTQLGGTLAYMSPEHLRALTTRSPVLARGVDHRADIYSLGMVLYEMLSGRSPFDQSASYTPLPLLVEAMSVERGRGAPSLRKIRPDVPWSLESIVRRSLAADPSQRYQRAEHLAEDLRCFLEDRPLRHAPELSWRERGQKWVRRHPRLSWAGAVAVVSACVLLLASLALVSIRSRLVHTSDQLAGTEAEVRKRKFEAGMVLALFYVNTKNDLGDHIALGEAACRDTLALYEILDRSDWEEHPDWKRIRPEERMRLSEDARDLLLLLAGARVRLAKWDREALLQALDFLDRAERISNVSPCQALWIDRAAYLQYLDRSTAASEARTRANSIPVATARDHYLLAMTCVREHKYTQAISHLDTAVRLSPRDYWSWMQRGLCYQELGEIAPAIGDFGTCVGLRPEFAWGYYNRAVALTAAGKRKEALVDYQRALELDPDLLAARLNCGVLHLELKQYTEAMSAFEAVEHSGRDDAALLSGLGIALEGLGRHEAADDAFARADRRAASEPPAVRRRMQRAYGFAVAERLPARARAAFAEVLRDCPNDPEALYGCGMLHDRKREPREALRYFSRALAEAPAFEEARRFRAVVLARSGNCEAARLDINVCLSKDLPSGATYYAAACVAALNAEQADAKTAGESAQEALQMLRAAFVRGYGLTIASEDQDLKGIHKHPEFVRLVAEGPRLDALNRNK